MSSRNILIVVEGETAEVNLYRRLLCLFPEIKLTPDNILTYKSSIWTLHNNLRKEFGDKWYESKSIDFLEFLKPFDEELCNKKITDIFLVFDYERQDTFFNKEELTKINDFFDESTENGKLYINYPMIESFRHLNTCDVSDNIYYEKKCNCCDLHKYKKIVGDETALSNLSKIDRAKMISIIKINLLKAFMIQNKDNLFMDDYEIVLSKINLKEILARQNEASSDDCGWVYILCTCLFFIPQYNYKLIME